jgi:hypothetical protein
MLRLLVRPNIVRRFTHTHSKTIFPENNNKIIEDLLREQNKHLGDISHSLYGITLCLFGIQACIIFKPIR